ncbi:MAG: hypothetical protein C4340_05015 [Armatimonadota bacterium]
MLIADKFVDKITPLIQTGSGVAAGQKLSFIGRGSQVDVFLPDAPGLEIAVQPGDRALGPHTVIARLHAFEADSGVAALYSLHKAADSCSRDAYAPCLTWRMAIPKEGERPASLQPTAEPSVR